jgi:hypothetical protein
VTGVRSFQRGWNVINNLVALGVGTVFPFSITGDDGEGYEPTGPRRMPVRCDGVLSWTGRMHSHVYQANAHQVGNRARELNRLDI